MERIQEQYGRRYAKLECVSSYYIQNKHKKEYDNLIDEQEELYTECIEKYKKGDYTAEKKYVESMKLLNKRRNDLNEEWKKLSEELREATTERNL